MSEKLNAKKQQFDCVTAELLRREENGEHVSREEAVEEYTLRLEGWREIEPLKLERGEHLPYPIDSLPPILRDPILELQKTVQAPLPMIAASFLASANLATQAHVDVATVDGRVIPTSLFFITVGLSGERKSTVDAFTMTAHRELDDRVRSEAEEKRAQIEAEIVVWERRKTAFQERLNKQRDGTPTLSKEQEREAFLAEVGPRPPAPQGAPTRIVRDPTVEGLEKHLVVSPYAGVFCDEAGAVLNGHSMKKENEFRTGATYSIFWDGKGVNRVRSGDGTISCPNRRLNMHLMMQPVVFNKFIAGNEGLKGQGFFARCLITRAPSTMGRRFFVRANPLTAPGMMKYTDRLREILAMPLPLKEGSGLELQPRVLPISREAEELYIEFYNEIEARLSSDGDLADITGTAAKIPEQALRFAATIQFLECPTSPEILKASMEVGILLARYYLSQALSAEHEGVIDLRLEYAENILTFIKRKELRTFSRNFIRQSGPPCARKTIQITDQLLEVLCQHGYLRIHRDEKNKQVTYLAHPKLWSKAVAE
jgi:hypothetical protein